LQELVFSWSINPQLAIYLHCSSTVQLKQAW